MLAANIAHEFSGIVHVPFEVVEGFVGQLSLDRVLGAHGVGIEVLHASRNPLTPCCA